MRLHTGAPVRAASIPVLIALAHAVSCSNGTVKSPDYPPIYPDYIGVTVPESLAALQFKLIDGRKFSRSERLDGDTVWVTVTAKGTPSTEYRPFPVYISHDAIDPYVSYRLIEPGYENWHDMGIYQRELASYKEMPVVTNLVNHRGCVNCHTYDGGSPERFLFHARGKGGGTVFVDGDDIRLLNLTKTGVCRQGVYPAWHPEGRYIVFSSNKTYQRFHVAGSQPIEVFDESSDLMMMDTGTDSTWYVPGLSEPHQLETFPAWSPDGTRLFCCCAEGDTVTCDNLGQIHYCLKALDFKNGRFVGEPRTVWREDSASVSFPRIKGDWLLFTKSAYGTFPIWHAEADLYLMNLRSGEVCAAAELNSPDTESYHSWSSNGRWVVFSSRRLDGRYTRLYIAHFDGDGHFSKPFLLPQKNPDFNQYRLKSYNIPEFMTDKVTDRQRQIKKLF